VNPAQQLRVWRRFHIRLFCLYGGLVFLVLTAFGALFYVRGVDSEMEGLQARLRGIATGLAEGISAAELDPLQAEGDTARPEYRKLVSRFAQVCEAERDVVSIYVLRPTERQGWMRFVADYVRVRPGRDVPAAKVGQLYDATQAHKLFEGLIRPTVEEAIYTDEWGETLSGYAPVLAPDGHLLGVVGVDVEAARIDRLKRDVLATTLFFYAVAAVLIAIASVMVVRNIRGPLSKIIQATSGIAEGHFEVRANLARADEFGILRRHFDQMAEGLEERERIRDTFGRYVDPEVVRRVLALKDSSRLGGVEREVTVVISDLRNYSTVSEHLPPQQVIGLINETLAGMNEVIDAHGGTIMEFLGDGILCVFNAPADQPDHAEQAVRCALGMRERLVQLNLEWETRGRAQARGARQVKARDQRVHVYSV
jgi:HAMP domain-containing protein